MIRFRIRPSRSGFTLAELLIVITILAIVATLVLPAVGNYLGDARADVTRQSLTRLRDVIGETYWQDNAALPQRAKNGSAVVPADRMTMPQLCYLFINPQTENASVTYDPVYHRGWRGPYLVLRQGSSYSINVLAGFSRQYGESGDPTVLDGWGRPIVVQNPPGVLPDGGQDVRLVSAGPDGVVNTPPGKATAALTAGEIGDDILVSFEVRQ